MGVGEFFKPTECEIIGLRVSRDDDARCVGEFRTTFRTIPAFVAQWIEQRFPKPQAVD